MIRTIGNTYFTIAAFIIAITLFQGPTAYSADKGKVTGAMVHQYPDWFKDSFLDFKEDAQEAADDNKHTMLFMSLNGCPYCTRMLNETFVEDRALIESDFDTIGLNIKGDRMVMLDGENEISEKDMARKLRVRFTPTIIFMDENAEVVFRVNGFWDAAQFRSALAFVNTKSYQKMSISEFVQQRKQEKIWDFRSHDLIADKTDFSTQSRPLLVLFEDAGCSACSELHDELLARDDVRDQLKTYDFVRLDARAKSPLIDIDGNQTTAEEWAIKLGVSTSPTFIAFDEGMERQRVDSRLYSHHFVSLLAYVSGKHYKTYDSWLRYNSKRTNEVLKKGVDIDLSDGRATASQ